MTGGDGLLEQLPADAARRREDGQFHWMLPLSRGLSAGRRVHHLDDRGEGKVTTRATACGGPELRWQVSGGPGNGTGIVRCRAGWRTGLRTGRDSPARRVRA